MGDFRVCIETWDAAIKAMASQVQAHEDLLRQAHATLTRMWPLIEEMAKQVQEEVVVHDATALDNVLGFMTRLPEAVEDVVKKVQDEAKGCRDVATAFGRAQQAMREAIAGLASVSSAFRCRLGPGSLTSSAATQEMLAGLERLRKQQEEFSAGMIPVMTAVRRFEDAMNEARQRLGIGPEQTPKDSCASQSI